MTAPFGIGFLGAGLATQAIHLPVIASRPDDFRVEMVMDIDSRVAARVAARIGARATTEARAVIEDPRVEIVVICSPDALHAPQLMAACEAGKRLVLCEKPLATTRDELAQIAEAAAETAIVVGTMHAYDPAWQQARQAWLAEPGKVDLVRSLIYLPPNERFIDLATDPVTSTSTVPTSSASPPPAADKLRRSILGLAVHDLPLVRGLVGDLKVVTDARLLSPYGYQVTLEADHAAANLVAVMGGAWSPSWTVEALGPERRLEVKFTPSYVLTGSARATLTVDSSSTTWEYETGGYEAEWDHVLALLRGEATDDHRDVVLADLAFALDTADGAVSVLEEER